MTRHHASARWWLSFSMAASEGCPDRRRAVDVLAGTGVVLLGQLSTAGVPVAIVTNNSVDAVEAYLRLHDLTQLVAVVAARPFGRPERMEPAPDTLMQAMSELDVRPEECIAGLWSAA